MKVIRPKPEFPARCACGRFHGGRYHQVKGAPLNCFVPRGAAAYDPDIHEAAAAPVDLRDPPHRCAACRTARRAA